MARESHGMTVSLSFFFMCIGFFFFLSSSRWESCSHFGMRITLIFTRGAPAYTCNTFTWGFVRVWLNPLPHSIDSSYTIIVCWNPVINGLKWRWRGKDQGGQWLGFSVCMDEGLTNSCLTLLWAARKACLSTEIPHHIHTQLLQRFFEVNVFRMMKVRIYQDGLKMMIIFFSLLRAKAWAVLIRYDKIMIKSRQIWWWRWWWWRHHHHHHTKSFDHLRIEWLHLPPL